LVRSHRQRGRSHAHAVALVVAIATVACAACGGGNGSSPSAGSTNSKAALEYGLGPEKNDQVTFQPDVVIVSGGPDSIRSVSDGGLTWTIDGSAAGVQDLTPGKIMFVTGRGVGRVLAIADAGPDRKVTIGPVTVTDVIRDGTFEQSGISLADAFEHQGVPPDFESEDTGQATPSALLSSTVAPQGVELAAAHGTGADVRLVADSGTNCCSHIHGAINKDTGDFKFFGTADLDIDKPGATFKLAITAGGIKHAELKVTGGMSLHVDFQAGVEHAQGSRTFQVPLGSDFSVPLGLVLGVPLSVTVHQSVLVKTAFGAQVGTIKGDGTFALGAALGFSYDGSKFSNDSQINFTRKQSLIDSLKGVPVGVMGVVIDHLTKFTVGFSAFVLTAGVYVLLDTKVGATLGSGLGAPLAECRGVGVGVFASFGIGYTLRQSVADLVNKFLSLFKVKPINREGGIRSPQQKLFSAEEVVPDVAICGHAGDAGPASGGGGGG
jgi:hypothetical protein